MKMLKALLLISFVVYAVHCTPNHEEEEKELSEIEEILQKELTQNDDEDLRDPKPIFSFVKSLFSRRRSSSHDERYAANVNDPKTFKPFRWIKSKLTRRRGTVIVHRRTGSRTR
eukprot:TCONS_00021886-protein